MSPVGTPESVVMAVDAYARAVLRDGMTGDAARLRNAFKAELRGLLHIHDDAHRLALATISEWQARTDLLRVALEGMVALYGHPDGSVIVEAGASNADDALIAALAALDAEEDALVQTGTTRRAGDRG